MARDLCVQRGEGSGGTANLEECKGSFTQSLVALRDYMGWG